MTAISALPPTVREVQEKTLPPLDEAIFAVACLSTAVVVGAMREAESSARHRARA